MRLPLSELHVRQKPDTILSSLPEHEPLLRANVVACQIRLVTNVQTTTADHRMRPRRQSGVADLEASMLSIGRWRRLDESDHEILTEDVEISVGRSQRAFADRAISPGDLTGRELQT